MSIELITFMMFASMLLLLLTGREIFVIIGGVGTIAALALWGTGGQMMPFLAGFSFIRWYPLLVIPPFIFMGYVLAGSGVADKLFHAIYIWMGHVNGGLAIGTIVICSLIAAISGGSAPGTVTAGTIALPAMLQRKYDKRMVTGTVQAGGALGILIPPSIIFIIYGIIARVSIGHLWVAGVLPGILLAIMHMTYIGVRCYFNPKLGPALSPEEQATWGEKFRALTAGIAPLILIFAVLGLLFMGVTTLVESASVAAIGALVCAAIYRRFTFKLVREALDKTLMVSSMILWIIAAAFVFASVFDGLGAFYVIERLLEMTPGGRWGILVAMMLSFFFMGMVLDDTAMLLIVAPLYIPLVMELDFDLVWYGVLYVLNVQMAYLTPPFGINLFLIRGVAPPEITMGDIYRSVIPFVGVQAICLVIVMVFPQIALWLPGVVFGK